MARMLIGFAPFAALAAVHIGALAVGAEAVAAPTKLLLMPLLAGAVVWSARGSRWTTAHTLLAVAIGMSWLGDGAATFFPWAETVPMMLLCFGLAHFCYIRLFWRVLPIRRMPLWTLVYAAWWVGLLAVLWPHLGGLLVPVALYGLVLGATAAGAARCHPLIVWGGVFFLASDSILAFRLFLPESAPAWTSPLVMLTYCLGQALIAAGALVAARSRRPERVSA